MLLSLGQLGQMFPGQFADISSFFDWVRSQEFSRWFPSMFEPTALPPAPQPAPPTVPAGALAPGYKTEAGLPVGKSAEQAIDEMIAETQARQREHWEAYMEETGQAEEQRGGGFPWTTLLLTAGGFVAVLVLTRR